MSTIQITEDIRKSSERAYRMLAGIEGGAERALKSAMTRAASHLRANAGRAIREQYDISQAALRTEKNVRVSYDFQNGAQVTITYCGQKIPLYRYGGTSPKIPTQNRAHIGPVFLSGLYWRQVYPGVTSSAHILRSTSPKTIPNTFVVRMPNGHTGIFERTGGVTSSGADALRELMGLSVPQMLGNEKVYRKLADEAMQKLDERLDHEIMRLLNGW